MLADAEAERATILRLLKSQLDLFRQQIESQKKLTEMSQQKAQMGIISADDALKAKQALAESKAKLQQLQILEQMYESLGTAPESTEP